DTTAEDTWCSPCRRCRRVDATAVLAHVFNGLHIFIRCRRCVDACRRSRLYRWTVYSVYSVYGVYGVYSVYTLSLERESIGRRDGIVPLGRLKQDALHDQLAHNSP